MSAIENNMNEIEAEEITGQTSNTDYFSQEPLSTAKRRNKDDEDYDDYDDEDDDFVDEDDYYKDEDDDEDFLDKEPEEDDVFDDDLDIDNLDEDDLFDEDEETPYNQISEQTCPPKLKSMVITSRE